MFLSQIEAEIIIDPYKNLFIETIHSAWRNYWSPNLDYLRHVLSARTRANIVYDSMVSDAKDRFAGIKGIKFHDFGRIFFMEIKEKIIIRFKKLNDNKMPSNIPTEQAKGLMEQKELPGMPPNPTILVAGYEINRLQTNIRAVTITCPNGLSNAWAFELERIGVEIPEVTELIFEQVDTPIRIKNKEKEKLEGTNE